MFITFEGLDGAGKTTQLQRLQRRLQAAGHTVVCTREPGGTEIGDRLRDLLLNPDHHRLAAQTEVLMYAASRAQLVAEVIRPALARGATVLCDRFVDASIAYQGAGLQLGEDVVAAINRFAVQGVRPDLTILIDLPAEDSRRRLEARRAQGARLDRIEQRDREYFHRVRAAFLRIAAQEPDRVAVVDGRGTPDEVEQEIWGIVANHTRKGGA